MHRSDNQNSGRRQAAQRAKTAGPAYRDVALTCEGNAQAQTQAPLKAGSRGAGSGRWGTVPVFGHVSPQTSRALATLVLRQQRIGVYQFVRPNAIFSSQYLSY